MVLEHKHYIGFLAILIAIVFFMSRDTPSVVSHVQAQTPSVVQTPPAPLPVQGKYEYLEITNSCDAYFEGLCIPVYSGPNISNETVHELRNGMVLKVKNKVERNGQVWYQVHFAEWLRYPERVDREWYIPAVAGRIVTGNGEEVLKSSDPKTNKRIVVDLSDHMIYAYDGSTLFLTTKVSTGIEFTPTPTGTFTVYKKMPSRYMQGPLPGVSDVPFDLPGVPWNLYFTEGGAVIHGSYWHDRYGTEQSSGCINLPPEVAKILYDWAELGTTVTVRN